MKLFVEILNLKRSVLTIVLALLTVSVAIMLFGYHWGWIDDMYINQTINQTFYARPSLTTFYYSFIAEFLMFLSSIIKNVNWLLTFNLVIISCIFSIIWLIFLKPIYLINSKLMYFFSFCFSFVFLFESILTATFTTISLLLLGVSSIAFLYFKKNNYIFLLFFVIAILIRFETSFLLVPILGVYYLKEKKLKRSLILLFVFIVVLISIKINVRSNGDLEDFITYAPLITNSLDNHNSKDYQEMSEIDSARSLAFFSWFQGDYESILNEKFRKELSVHPAFSIKTLKKALLKIKTEYKKACCRYNENYTPYRNWLLKGIIGYFFLSIIAIYFFTIQDTNKSKYFNIVIWFTFTTTILTTIVFFKMEYRVFYPLLIVSYLVLFVLNKNKIDNSFLKKAIILMLFLIPFRFIEYSNTSFHLKLESKNKEVFQKELKTKFKNKMLLFDFLTISFNSPKVFDNTSFSNENNTLLIYGEVYSNFMTSHKNHLSKICISHEIVPFFKCLYQKKSEVIFVFTSYRVKMYELYFKEVYNLDLKFKKMENCSNALNSIEYSYVWNKIDADYYVFDLSFEDVK